MRLQTSTGTLMQSSGGSPAAVPAVRSSRSTASAATTAPVSSDVTPPAIGGRGSVASPIVPWQVPPVYTGLADPGPIPSGGSDHRVLDTDLRLSYSGSAGGSFTRVPGGGTIQLPRPRSAMTGPTGPGPSVRPRLDPQGWTGQAMRVDGHPFPPTLHLEMSLHHAMILRDQVRRTQGEAEALRQFGSLEVWLQRFVNSGFRVEPPPAREERPEETPQGSGSHGQRSSGGAARDKGKAPE